MLIPTITARISAMIKQNLSSFLTAFLLSLLCLTSLLLLCKRSRLSGIFHPPCVSCMSVFPVLVVRACIFCVQMLRASEKTHHHRQGNPPPSCSVNGISDLLREHIIQRIVFRNNKYFPAACFKYNAPSGISFRNIYTSLLLITSC